MAFVVATKPGWFEVRESRSTPEGPRSRTLASFRELTEETTAKAIGRAAKPPTAGQLRESAIRAGAPVAGREIDESGRAMLRLIAGGQRPDPMLRALLLDALGDGDGAHDDAAATPKISDAARSAMQWIGVGPDERGRALRDLLELADALPVRPRSPEIGFPRLRSA